MTWRSTAAKVAEKKRNLSAVSLLISLVCHLEQWEDVFSSFLNQFVGDYYLDRNPFTYYELFGLHIPYLIWRGTVYQDDCQPKQCLCGFCHITSTLTNNLTSWIENEASSQPSINTSPPQLFVDQPWQEDMQDDEWAPKRYLNLHLEASSQSCQQTTRYWPFYPGLTTYSL